MSARRRCAAAVLGAALVHAAAAGHADAPRAALLDRLRAAYYAFEVAGYCGLVTEAVGRGFRAERSRLESAAHANRDEIERLRGEAWQAAHAEWQNRGLGGFRGWCADEGRAAAARFEGVAGR